MTIWKSITGKNTLQSVIGHIQSPKEKTEFDSMQYGNLSSFENDSTEQVSKEVVPHFPL